MKEKFLEVFKKYYPNATLVAYRGIRHEGYYEDTIIFVVKKADFEGPYYFCNNWTCGCKNILTDTSREFYSKHTDKSLMLDEYQQEMFSNFYKVPVSDLGDNKRPNMDWYDGCSRHK